MPPKRQRQSRLKPSTVRNAGELSTYFTWSKPHSDLYRLNPEQDNISIFEKHMRSVHFRDPTTNEAYFIGHPSTEHPCWADYYLNQISSDQYERVNIKTGERELCVWCPGSIHVTPTAKNVKVNRHK